MNESDVPNETLLDDALGAVRDDRPDAGAEAAALARTAKALPPANRVIEDFESLIPEYLAGSLGPGRRLLFDEELKGSARLRRVLQSARRPTAASAGPASVLNRPRRPLLLAAAAGVAAVAIALAFLLDYFPAWPPPDQSRLAQIEPGTGAVYAVAGTGLRRLAVGDWLTGEAPLRTGKAGSTRIRLDDGTLVEIEARTQFRLLRRPGGNLLHMDRGRVFVQAASQGDRTLEVATDDLVVAVKGTVFGVSRGTKARGSRWWKAKWKCLAAASGLACARASSSTRRAPPRRASPTTSRGARTPAAMPTCSRTTRH